MLTGMDGVMKGTRARQKWVAVVQAVQYYDALYSSDRMDRCADVVIPHLTPVCRHTIQHIFNFLIKERRPSKIFCLLSTAVSAHCKPRARFVI